MCYTCNSNINNATWYGTNGAGTTPSYGCQRVCRDANGFLRCTQYGSVSTQRGCCSHSCGCCCHCCHCCQCNGCSNNGTGESGNGGTTSGNNDGGYGCLTICGNFTANATGAQSTNNGYYARQYGSYGRCGRGCGCYR